MIFNKLKRFHLFYSVLILGYNTMSLILFSESSSARGNIDSCTGAFISIDMSIISISIAPTSKEIH